MGLPVAFKSAVLFQLNYMKSTTADLLFFLLKKKGGVQWERLWERLSREGTTLDGVQGNSCPNVILLPVVTKLLLGY